MPLEANTLQEKKDFQNKKGLQKQCYLNVSLYRGGKEAQRREADTGVSFKA